MSYYTALITAWNNASLATGATLPSGVTGSLLNGLTTAQKIATINAWMITGTALAPNIPVGLVKGCIQAADLLTLSATQQWAIAFMLDGAQDGRVYAPVGGQLRALFANVFAGKTTTLNALSALVATYDTPAVQWATAPNGAGLASPVSVNDTQNAGLS